MGFKDRALPAKAVLAVVSKADVMDGKVEVDRRANTPEALLAALSQKEAELEELKARYAGSGPSGRCPAVGCPLPAGLFDVRCLSSKESHPWEHPEPLDDRRAKPRAPRRMVPPWPER
ncbi:DUF2381 family protein [Stigmatella aurantiaca]|uniref:Uncharacterized protein n=1 Tax=Stigmatella aurantiaca (strain DW4/3-1) TaxID=378806 RepID=Q08SR7_STIAD|nr:DUF2381 family protein [Stigmatella aurantiaca]ADO72929.1 uncharacterized protein STAUR_5157 [Stigmatella aurantiaca DW4/3-1]EAU63535.1 hypothetical protein STIAU_7212 [Stigmatella aurantiaca DW4/3-1]